MEVKLHANATTTPKMRAYIQASTAGVGELAKELGIGESTIRRWKNRDSVTDRSHCPKKLPISLSEVEERLAIELRTSLQLSLDDIVEVMHRCVNEKLSRSAIHRCLQRHGVSARPKPSKASPGTFDTDHPLGFIHFDLKHLPPLHRQKAYVFVAIDRATRYVYVEIHRNRKAVTAQAFLRRFVKHFPYKVHTILTDNGSEFTDRFAVDMKNKPKGRPSGNHPFDTLCKQYEIEHRLTRPFHPQTNGMVERFNRRIGEHLNRMPQNRAGHHRRFNSHQERDDYILQFVANYNRTRLRCLEYKAPLQVLANLTEYNTSAWAAHKRWATLRNLTVSV